MNKCIFCYYRKRTTLAARRNPPESGLRLSRGESGAQARALQTLARLRGGLVLRVHRRCSFRTFNPRGLLAYLDAVLDLGGGEK
jgi:hypothetical protein